MFKVKVVVWFWFSKNREILTIKGETMPKYRKIQQRLIGTVKNKKLYHNIATYRANREVACAL